MKDERLAEWLRRARSGDNVAVENLYDLHMQQLRPFVERIAPPWIDAREVCHDAFQQTRPHLRHIENDGAYIGYVRRVAQNIVKKRIHEAALRIPIEEIAEATAFDPGLRNIERVELLDAMNAVLTDDDRPIFRVVFRDKLSTAEAADALGVSREVFSLRKHRMLRRLQDEIERRWGDGGPLQL